MTFQMEIDKEKTAMKNKMVCKKICVVSMAIAMAAFSVTGCGKAADAENIEVITGEGTGNNSADSSTQAVVGESVTDYTNAEAVTLLSYGDVFTDRDLSGEYEEAECVKILLDGSSASCDSDAVQINGGTVTIAEEGTYLLEGALKEGMVIVDAEDTAKVQLVLNGVEISNSSNAAIYVKQADKVFVTLAGESQNTLTSSGYTSIDDNNIDACIFSKCDLTVNGTGSLTVRAEEGHGIVSKDDLKVTGGNLTITAEKHGLSGKDSVCVAEGILTIASGKDSIHSENADDVEKGYAYLAGGVLTLTAEGDGISAGSFLQIDGGSFNIVTGGGSANTAIAKDEDGSAVSTKGIKAGGQLVVNDGSFVIDSQDDSVHSDNSLAVNGGTFQLASGDDAIHAGEKTMVAGGSINISTCYEGIEGNAVEVSGGYISLYATDDGINAAGGNDESGFGGRFGRDSFGTTGETGSEHTILISGGEVFINADGDGIDANGGVTMTGGEVYVSGPSGGGNGALDYDGTGQITGGTIVALGAAGMAMNFNDAPAQGSILITTAAGMAGTEVILKDANGKELVSYTAEKAFNSVVISCPELVQGGTYTISVGGEDTTITLDSLIYGNGSGMGGFGGGRGGFGGQDGLEGGKGGSGGNKNGSDGMGGFEGGKGERPEGSTDMQQSEAPELPSGETGEMPQMPERMEKPQGGQMPGGNSGRQDGNVR